MFIIIIFTLLTTISTTIAQHPNPTTKDSLQTNTITSTEVNANTAIFIWDKFIQSEPTNDTDNQGRVLLEGVGNIFTAGLLSDALFMFNFQNNAYFNMEYRPVGSGDFTICRLQGYLEHCKHPFIEYGGSPTNTDANHPVFVDYTVDDVVPPPSVYEKTPDFQLYPFAVTATVPIYNIPGVNKLILTTQVLARIMRGCDEVAYPTTCQPNSIRYWGHSDILALNPNETHPYLIAAGNIKRVVFSNSSGVTGGIKGSLFTTDPGFKAQFREQTTYDKICSNVWPGPVEIYARGLNGYGVSAIVLRTPSSIGYAAYPIFLTLRPQPITLMQDPSKPDELTVITPQAIQRAVLTVGMNYGNNLDDPVHKTISLAGTTASDAWPFSFYHYVSLRKHTTRLGPQFCTIANATLSFLTFFYTNEALHNHMPSLGWVPPPSDGLDDILTSIRQDLKCDPGNTNSTSDNLIPVYVSPRATPKIRIIAPVMLQEILKLHIITFQVQLHTTVDFEFEEDVTAQQIIQVWKDSNINFGQIVFADENLSTDLSNEDQSSDEIDLINVGYAGLGMGFAYRLCAYGLSCPYSHIDLIISLPVAANILDGKITWWNDTEIQALNPTVAADLPPERIIVLSGPQDNEMHYTFLNKIRRCCDASFTYKGPPGMEIAHTYQQQRTLMYSTPFTFGYTPLNASKSDNVVSYARVMNRANVPVAATTENIEACGLDTFEPTAGTNSFNIDVSKAMNCYPLVMMIHIITQRQYHNESQGCYDGRTDGFAFDLAQFLAYLFSGKKVVAPMEDRQIGVFSDLTVTPVGETGQIHTATLITPILESITCGDSNPTSMVKVPHNLNLIPQSLIYFVYAMYVLMIGCVVILMVWILLHRDRKLVRNSSPAFMLQVLFGAAVQCTTVIPLSQQDDQLVDRAMTEANLASEDTTMLDISCASEPILFTVGFFIMYSALFLKAWRLIRIFNNTKLRHLYVKDAQLFAYQAAVVTFVVALNLTWVLTDPLHWKRSAKISSERLGLVINSVGLCECHTAASAIPLLIGVLGVLILGNYLAYLGRHIPTEFNESKWTAMAMVVNLEAVLLGLPILVLANDNPTTGYVIKVFILMLMASATVGLVFLPKLALAYGWFVVEGDGSDVWRFAHSSGSNSAGAANNNNNNNNLKASMSNKIQMVGGGVAVESNKVSSMNQMTTNNNVHHATTNKNGTVISNKVPSLASLIDHSFAATTGSVFGTNNKGFVPPLQSQKPTTTTAALVQVLEEDPLRRRLRRFLTTQQADENIRFFDAVESFQKDPESKRASSARAIIQYFIQDSAPKQINLKAETREKLLRAFRENNNLVLSDGKLFDDAMAEVFNDLKQSDAFQQYLAGGGATSMNLGSEKPNSSDVSLS
jgi:ABC-type phosphate transport system substrate-binding protein